MRPLPSCTLFLDHPNQEFTSFPHPLKSAHGGVYKGFLFFVVFQLHPATQTFIDSPHSVALQGTAILPQRTKASILIAQTFLDHRIIGSSNDRTFKNVLHSDQHTITPVYLPFVSLAGTNLPTIQSLSHRCTAKRSEAKRCRVTSCVAYRREKRGIGTSKAKQTRCHHLHRKIGDPSTTSAFADTHVTEKTSLAFLFFSRPNTPTSK